MRQFLCSTALLLLLSAPTYATDPPKVEPTTIETTDACSPDLTSLSAASQAALNAQPQAILVIDATTKQPTSRLFVSNQQQVINEIATICAAGDPTPLGKWLATQPKNDRFISQLNDTLHIYILAPAAKKVEVRATETPRDTKIHQDIKVLWQLIKDAGIATLGSQQTTQLLKGGVPLAEERAILTVESRVTDGTAGDKTAFTTVATITTGGEEHFSLSAVLPVNAVKTLTFDKDTKQVVAKDAPKEFLVGFDYHLGDVFDHATWMPNRNTWVFSGVCRFSKAPLDTLGAVVGWRLPVGTIVGGPIWIREDKSTTTATNENRHYKMHLRVGVSFDLKQAVSWLADTKKKDTSKASTAAKP